MERHVRIFDTTLRDGEQTPGVHLTSSAKITIARQLEAYGVDTIEAGFPVSSPGDEEAVRQIATTVRGCEIAALARCITGDIEAAARALEPAAHPVIHVFLGASDIHLRHKLGMTRSDAIRAIRTAVTLARQQVGTVQFSAEDATRAERTFLKQCVATAIECGASRINLPDTVGCALPNEYAAMIRDMNRFVGPDIMISAHCHDDMGLATANSIAAVQAGAEQLEVTVNGIGERAGNAAIEEVCVILDRKGIATTKVRLEQTTALSTLVAESTRVPVQPNRSVVGANAFSHSSGIHQDGILKYPETYEFVPPALVGVDGHRFVLTARSGRKAVAHVAEQAGRPLSPNEIESVYAAFLHEADVSCGAVDPQAIARILGEVCGTVPAPNPPETSAPRTGRWQETCLL